MSSWVASARSSAKACGDLLIEDCRRRFIRFMSRPCPSNRDQYLVGPLEPSDCSRIGIQGLVVHIGGLRLHRVCTRPPVWGGRRVLVQESPLPHEYSGAPSLRD